MSGLEVVPIRWPAEYDPKFMEIIFREVLQFADVRNAIEGIGISVSGSSDGNATITNTAAQASYVVLGANVELENERILAVESGTLTLTDAGAGLTITISIGNIPVAKGGTGGTTAATGATGLELGTADAVVFLTAEAGAGGFLVSGIKVVGAQEAAIASLTDSTGGSADGTLVAIGDTSTSNEGSKINDNFTEINGKLDAILAAIRAHGLINT